MDVREVRSLQPAKLDNAISFERGRPAAAARLGDLHYSHLTTDTITGYINGHLFASKLRCVDGDAHYHHWIHTDRGRVRISPADRARLFNT